MLSIDLHIHTLRSNEAFSTLYEIAYEAHCKDMLMIGITDHGPGVAEGAVESYFYQGKRLPKEMLGVRLLFGAELNIMDEQGILDLPAAIIDRLDIVAAGLHRPAHNTLAANTLAMVNAIKNGQVKVITHPCASAAVVDIETVAYEAIRHKVLLEINASHFRYPELMDDGYFQRLQTMIKICQDHYHPMIIGSDAHFYSEVGDDAALLKHFRELGINGDYIINNDLQGVKEFFGVE